MHLTERDWESLARAGVDAGLLGSVLGLRQEEAEAHLAAAEARLGGAKGAKAAAARPLMTRLLERDDLAESGWGCRIRHR